MRVKRLFDVVVGSVVAVLVLPAVALMAAGAGASLHCWPFFVQQRVGFGGRRFRMLKVRTLPVDFPRYADKYALTNVVLPWFPRFLRDHHLDELPQLLQVPFGHMSLVGPRPEMPHLHAAMEPPIAAARTSVRPGCTGLWQVSSSARMLINEAPEYDEFYVRHASLALDAWILWRSLLALVGGSSSVTIDDVPGWARRARPQEATLIPSPVGVDQLDAVRVSS